MSILSYSQNFEDVLLWRALQHVQNGTYVDIGAQDPVVDSVSKAFYLRGWRGVNVDPNVTYVKALEKDRAEDLVIHAAVGTSEHPIRFFCIRDTGLSTGIPSIAEEHRQIGYEVDATTVPVVTLASILSSLATDEIHWMKIDVEGMEADVLDSWGKCEVRPWILVIEATHPNSQRKTEAAWVEKVSVRGYHEVHFDGLSRYFVSDNHPEIDKAFESPPNVFDGFQVATHHFSVAEICQEHENEVARLQAVADEAARTANAKLLDEYHQMEDTKQELERTVQALSSDRDRATALLDERTSAWAGRAASLKAEIVSANEKCDRLEKLLFEAREASSNNRERAAWTIAVLASRVESDARNAVEWTKRDETMRRQFSEITDKHTDSLVKYERLQADLRAKLEQANKALSACTSARELDRIEWEAQVTITKQESAKMNALLDDALQALAQKGSEADATALDLTCRIKEHEEYTSQLLEQIKLSSDNFNKLQNTQHQLSLQIEGVRLDAEIAKSAYDSLLRFIRQQRNMGLAGFFRRMTSKFGFYNHSSWEKDILKESFSYLTRNKNDMKHFPESTSEKSEGTLDSIVPVYDIQSLISLSGMSFVECSYITLLGRLPDPQGAQYYRLRLESGWTKASIIRQLRSSHEGRRYNAKVDGLNQMVARYQRISLPLIGWIFRAIYNEESDSTVERTMRRVSNLVEEISYRIDEIITINKCGAAVNSEPMNHVHDLVKMSHQVNEIHGAVLSFEHSTLDSDTAFKKYHQNNVFFETRDIRKNTLFMSVEDILKIAE